MTNTDCMHKVTSVKVGDTLFFDGKGTYCNPRFFKYIVKEVRDDRAVGNVFDEFK